jgi:hypothetical protein
MLAPSDGSTTGAGATTLAVGALALLAGHTWGLLVMVPAHVVLVGRLWPAIAIASSGDLSIGETAAIAVVLTTALPTLILGAVALPGIVGHLLPERSPRLRAMVVAGGALALAAALILPALSVPPRTSTTAVARAVPADTASIVVTSDP